VANAIACFLSSLIETQRVTFCGVGRWEVYRRSSPRIASVLAWLTPRNGFVLEPPIECLLLLSFEMDCHSSPPN